MQRLNWKKKKIYVMNLLENMSPCDSGTFNNRGISRNNDNTDHIYCR